MQPSTRFPKAGFFLLLAVAIAILFLSSLVTQARTFSAFAQVLDAPSEATADRIELEGTWARSVNTQAKSGVVAVSDTPESSLVLHATGDSFTLFRRMSPDGGQMWVTIDGQEYGSLEFYFPLERWSVPAYFDQLGPGSHEIVFTLSEYKNDRSSGHRVAIEAVEVPSQFVANSEQVEAVEYFNSYRQKVGLPPVRGSSALHVAAQNHANFFVTEWTESCITDYPTAHYECPETAPGYTGYSPNDRVRYAGYLNFGGEVLTQLDDPVDAIDNWMSVPYHRSPIISYSIKEIGYGASTHNASEAAAIKLSSGGLGVSRPAQRLIYTYPTDKQTGVLLALYSHEQPEPLPGIERPVGSLLSFYIAQPQSDPYPPQDLWHVESATLHTADNQPVPLYVLHQGTDPNMAYVPNTIHLFPQLPMAVNSTYTAHVAGIDSQGVPFDHSWSFTTIAATDVTEEWVDAGGTGARLTWVTPALLAEGWVEYGTTEAYGQEAPMSQSWEYDGRFYGEVYLTDLQPATTYYYRIVTGDGAGNRYPMPGRNFVTRLPATIHVPADVANLTTALYSARVGDTIEIAAGTHAISETLYLPSDVHLMGQGATETILHAPMQAITNSALVVGGESRVEGFTLVGNQMGTGLFVRGESAPILHDLHIYSYTYGIQSTGSPLIAQSVIAHSSEMGIGLYEGEARLVNNTVVGGEYGIYAATDGTQLRNTIITDQELGLLVASDVTVEHGYLAFWNNDMDSYGAGTGTGNLFVDPCFTNAAAADYTLCANSPLRDAGDPDPTYNDEDGSRNDIGASGSPQFVADLLVRAPITTPVPLPTPTPLPSVMLVPPAVGSDITPSSLYIPHLEN